MELHKYICCGSCLNFETKLGVMQKQSVLAWSYFVHHGNIKMSNPAIVFQLSITGNENLK